VPVALAPVRAAAAFVPGRLFPGMDVLEGLMIPAVDIDTAHRSCQPGPSAGCRTGQRQAPAVPAELPLFPVDLQGHQDAGCYDGDEDHDDEGCQYGDGDDGWCDHGGFPFPAFGALAGSDLGQLDPVCIAGLRLAGQFFSAHVGKSLALPSTGTASMIRMNPAVLVIPTSGTLISCWHLLEPKAMG